VILAIAELDNCSSRTLRFASKSRRSIYDTGLPVQGRPWDSQNQKLANELTVRCQGPMASKQVVKLTENLGERNFYVFFDFLGVLFEEGIIFIDDRICRASQEPRHLSPGASGKDDWLRTQFSKTDSQLQITPFCSGVCAGLRGSFNL
jgi:hypothetical protein